MTVEAGTSQVARGLPGSTRPPGVLTDRLFRYAALGGGLMVLVVLALIAISTTNQALPWFRAEGIRSITTDNWNPSANEFGALGLIYGTLVVSGLALLIAVPVSVGIALFVTEVSPKALRKPMIYTIDLLAAIPSVVFGLWGVAWLAPRMADAYSWVSGNTDGVPILEKLFAEPSASGLSFTTAGIIVAVMITPIMTSITREVYATVPPAQKEAALALGATRWEMIRGAVFPHSRSGVTAGALLGLGRAMGETIAVALLIGAAPRVTPHILGPGDAMASIVANQFGEASGTHRAALIGLGVVLFAMTILIGILARFVVGRSERKLAGA
jgi:phosphate transport system permease protein